MKLDPIERLNLAVAAGGVAGSYALASPAFAVSLALGAACGAMNFRALRSASERLFSGQIAGSGAWMAVFVLRFGLLLVVIALALKAGAHPAGFVMGLSAIVPAAAIGAFLMRPPVDPEASALDPEDPEWDRWNPWLAREADPEARSEDDDA